MPTAVIDGYLLNMRVFNDVGDGKGQAPPPGGAAGTPGACQGFDSMRDGLIDECMGTVQAIANLLAAIGATQGEVDAAIRRMDARNGDRGRL